MDRNLATRAPLRQTSNRSAKRAAPSAEAWFKHMDEQRRLLGLASDQRQISGSGENDQVQMMSDLVTDQMTRLAEEVAARRAENLRQLHIKAMFLREYLEDDAPDMLQELAVSMLRDIEALAGEGGKDGGRKPA